GEELDGQQDTTFSVAGAARSPRGRSVARLVGPKDIRDRAADARADGQRPQVARRPLRRPLSARRTTMAAEAWGTGAMADRDRQRHRGSRAAHSGSYSEVRL